MVNLWAKISAYLNHPKFLKKPCDLPFNSFEAVRVISKILDDYSHLIVEHKVRTEVTAFLVEKITQTSRYALKVDHNAVDMLFVVLHILVQSL